MRPFVLSLVVLLALAGCAGNAAHYYRLPDSRFVLPAQQPSVVLQVQLNNNLEGQALVYQSSTTQIHFARQHQWGEELAPAMAKSLANALNAQAGHDVYTVEPSSSLPVLTVHVEAFQGQYNGHTRISGYTRWSDGARQGRNFDVQTAQHGDGYNAMVQSLAKGLRQAAVQIAD